MLWFAHFRSVRGGFICFDSSRLTATRTVLMADQGSSLCLPVSWCLLPPSLTVTGASPLVDVSSTQVAGNVDRRQMEELPLQGRNWMELAMQVRGITANAVDTAPGVRARRVPGRHQPVRHHPGPAVGNCCRVASSSSIPFRRTSIAAFRSMPGMIRRGGTSPASTRPSSASTRTSATGPSTSRGRPGRCGLATPGA